jgi:hypothetical protein
MRSILVAAALFAELLASPAANAIEPYKLYDRFDEKPLDPSRWVDSEKIREIKGGGLHLMQRTWSDGFGDVGLFSVNWSNNFTNPASITQMRARVNVHALETNACSSNSSIADARARIIGGFFNVGVPTPGSQVGDMLAQIRFIRASNSPDPQGMLRVEGVVSVCTNSDCSFASTQGNVVSLGTVALGTAATVEMKWDKGGKTFSFSRDAGAFSGTVGYSQDDSNPPGNLFRQLSTRVNVPHCQSAARVPAVVDVRFDNVFVNQAALP